MGLDASDKDRIAGRKYAENACEHAIDKGIHFLEGFRRQLKRVFGSQVTSDDSMSDDEAIAFEAETIGFGKFATKTWGKADRDYIGWLADQSKQLHRYVASDRFKDRT